MPNLVEITVHATSAEAKRALDEIKAKLADLSTRVADARVKLSGNVEAQAQLARINARLMELNNRVADPKIKLEGIARAQAELLALLATMDKVESSKKFSFGSGAGGFFGAIQKGLAAILNLGPAAVPVLAAIAAAVLLIVSYLSSMVSAIAAAGLGLAAFGAFALPTFMKIVAGVQAVSAAANKVAKDKAWDAIPKALQPAVQMALQAKDAFMKLADAMRPEAVRVFAAALKVVHDLMPLLLPIAKEVGKSIEGLLKNFDQFVKSQGFKSFMSSMQQLAGPAMTAIGVGLGQVVIALGQFLQVAAGPQGIVALKTSFILLAGAIKLITLALRGAQNGWQAFLDFGFSATQGLIIAAKRVADAFLASVSTIARIASYIPGPWQAAAKKIADAAEVAKGKVDRTFNGMLTGLANVKHQVDSTQLVYKLQGNIMDLQNKLATARGLLANPNLTATRRARIEADISNLLAQISMARAALANINGSVATTYINTVYATSRGHAAGGIVGAAAGGLRAGMTMVGEHGRELVSLPPGSMVHSNPDTERMMSQGGGGTMRLVVSMDPQMPRGLSRELIRWLKFHVRTDGGGDVQAAFGGG